MVLSDTLSRRLDLCPENDNNNEDVVILPESLFVNLIDVDLQQQITDANELDADAAKVLKALLGGGPTAFWNDLAEWMTENFNGKKVLFYKGKNYIPKNLSLKQDILKAFHDHETAGIWESWRLTTQSGNIIGGLGFAHS